MVDRRVNAELNAQRIALVEQCFGNSGQPLAMLHRYLVGEGVLVKMCRKKPKPRQFFLFTDILVYGNIVISRKKYNKQRILQLETITLQSADDDENFNLCNGWQIISPSKSFTVYAATAVEKEEWIRHIQQCIEEMIKRQGHNRRPTAERSPVWIPDVDASTCMVCRKSEFTVLNRRHHCRHCGFVCCASCSNHRYLLRYISSTPVRICSICFSKLSSSQDSTGGAAVSSVGESSGDDSSESGDEIDEMSPSHAVAGNMPSFY